MFGVVILASGHDGHLGWPLGFFVISPSYIHDTPTEALFICPYNYDSRSWVVAATFSYLLGKCPDEVCVYCGGAASGAGWVVHKFRSGALHGAQGEFTIESRSKLKTKWRIHARANVSMWSKSEKCLYQKV